MSAFIDLLLFGLWCFFEEIAAQRGTKHICNSPWKFLIAGSWVWGGHITHTHMHEAGHLKHRKPF